MRTTIVILTIAICATLAIQSQNDLRAASKAAFVVVDSTGQYVGHAADPYNAVVRQTPEGHYGRIYIDQNSEILWRLVTSLMYESVDCSPPAYATTYKGTVKKGLPPSTELIGDVAIAGDPSNSYVLKKSPYEIREFRSRSTIDWSTTPGVQGPCETTTFEGSTSFQAFPVTIPEFQPPFRVERR
jgi:hypothetical protein